MNYQLEGEKLFKKIAFFIKNLTTPAKSNSYYPNLLKGNFLLFLVIAILVFKIASVAFYIPFPSNIFFADITKTELTDMLNHYRAERGLNELKGSDKLDEAALFKAKDMADNDYFSHNSPQGTTPWFWFKKAGYNYKYAGENLAAGFFDSKDVYYAWINSPLHKENMENPNYKEVGTAVLSGFGGNSAVLVVQLFGSPHIPAAVSSAQNNLPASSKTERAPANNKEESVSVERSSSSVENSSSKILPAATEQDLISGYRDNLKNNFYFRFMNLIVYNNSRVMQYILYVLLAFTTLSLFIVLSLDLSHRPQGMILKSFIIIMALLASITANSGVLSRIIPHNITI